MKNPFIVSLLLLLSASPLCMAMDGGQKYYENYKLQYNLEYSDALQFVASPMKQFILMRIIQLERQKRPIYPSIREYIKCYGINSDLLAKYAKKNVLIMHPGPINRGVELTQDVADSEYSVILNQVTNGVAVRMSVLFLLSQA